MVVPSALSPQAYAQAFRESREWVELGGDYRWHSGDLSDFLHTSENLGPPSEEAGAGGYVAASMSPLERLFPSGALLSGLPAACAPVRSTSVQTLGPMCTRLTAFRMSSTPS